MWTTAQILPIAMPIHAQRLCTGDRLNQFNLIGFIQVDIVLYGFVARPDFCANRLAFIDDGFHSFFNQTKIFWGKWLGAVKIVIPTVFNHWADCHLYVGPNLLHGAGHDMRQIMAHQLQRRHRVFHRVDSDCGVVFDGPLQIPMRFI